MMCRNIRSSSQLGNVTAGLPSLVISPRVEIDGINDKINALNISQGLERRIQLRHSQNSDGDFSWQHYSTSSESDFFIRSETGSESSCTDDLDSDSAQRLREEFENFEASLYNDLPYSSLTESVLKESRLLALHSPHLRINGVKCKIHEIVEENNLHNEEDLSDETIVCHGVFSDTSDTDELSEESDSSDETISEPEETGRLNEDTCEILFKDIWPSIVDKVRPAADKLIRLTYNRAGDNFVELTPSELRYAIDFERKFLGARNLLSSNSVSPLLFRSKSSRDQYNCSTSDQLVVSDESIPLRTFSKSSNACDRKRQIVKLNTAAISPPTISVTFKRDNKVNRTHTLSAKVNKSSSIICHFDYRSKVEMKPAILRPNKARHGLLPPIENLDIGSKSDQSRSSSAMIRCRTSSSQPQHVASHNRSLLAPIELKKHVHSQNKRKPSNVNEDQTQEPYDRSPHPVDLRQGRQIRPIPWK